MRVKFDLTGKELIDYLINHKTEIINQKKSTPIFSDNFVCKNLNHSEIETVIKEQGEEDRDPFVLNVRTAANTANFIDSHMDMILPNAPKKSIRERKGIIPHIHDHIYQATAKVGEVKDITLEDISLKELGLKGTGTTQVTVFETDIIKDYNAQVFAQYKNNGANQHSIGLQYMDIDLAVNNPDSKAEYKIWEKYYTQAINKEVAEQRGFFWVVKQYRLIENSTVLFGSNSATPTISGKSQPPSQDTGEGSQHSTPKKSMYRKLI